jgi:hypothetical protein
LIHFVAGGDLAGLQKSFDEFAFAADGHAGKFLEPFSFRHFGLRIQPAARQDDLFVRNVR